MYNYNINEIFSQGKNGSPLYSQTEEGTQESTTNNDVTIPLFQRNNCDPLMDGMDIRTPTTPPTPPTPPTPLVDNQTMLFLESQKEEGTQESTPNNDVSIPLFQRNNCNPLMDGTDIGTPTTQPTTLAAVNNNSTILFPESETEEEHIDELAEDNTDTDTDTDIDTESNSEDLSLYDTDETENTEDTDETDENETVAEDMSAEETTDEATLEENSSSTEEEEDDLYCAKEPPIVAQVDIPTNRKSLVSRIRCGEYDFGSLDFDDMSDSYLGEYDYLDSLEKDEEENIFDFSFEEGPEFQEIIDAYDPGPENPDEIGALSFDTTDDKLSIISDDIFDNTEIEEDLDLFYYSVEPDASTLEKRTPRKEQATFNGLCNIQRDGLDKNNFRALDINNDGYIDAYEISFLCNNDDIEYLRLLGFITSGFKVSLTDFEAFLETVDRTRLKTEDEETEKELKARKQRMIINWLQNHPSNKSDTLDDNRRLYKLRGQMGIDKIKAADLNYDGELSGIELLYLFPKKYYIAETKKLQQEGKKGLNPADYQPDNLFCAGDAVSVDSLIEEYQLALREGKGESFDFIELVKKARKKADVEYLKHNTNPSEEQPLEADQTIILAKQIENIKKNGLNASNCHLLDINKDGKIEAKELALLQDKDINNMLECRPKYQISIEELRELLGSYSRMSPITRLVLQIGQQSEAGENVEWGGFEKNKSFLDCSRKHIITQTNCDDLDMNQNGRLDYYELKFIADDSTELSQYDYVELKDLKPVLEEKNCITFAELMKLKHKKPKKAKKSA